MALLSVLCISHHLPTKLGISNIEIPSPPKSFPQSALHSPSSTHFPSKIRSGFCCCSSNEDKQQVLEGFSVLECDPTWECGSVWTTTALYFFSLHIPLSFGGLSVATQMLGQPDLEPQVKAVAILVIETLELCGTLLLLQLTAKPLYRPVNFFKPIGLRSQRNCFIAAVLGFVILAVAISLTSFLAESLVRIVGGNIQVLKDILFSGLISRTACTLVYCIVAPLLEEIVYRRFLLTSLASTMQWHQAVVISSIVFSASHLSGNDPGKGTANF